MGASLLPHFCCCTAEDQCQSLQQDTDVDPEATPAQVFEVDTQLRVQLELHIVLLRIGRSLPVGRLHLGVEDLTGTGEPRSHAEDSKLFRVVPLQEEWDLRSWTNQGHVPFEDVEELRQLVQLDARSNAPTFVTLGSDLSVMSGPTFSASCTMDRNLSIVNEWPERPTLICL